MLPALALCPSSVAVQEESELLCISMASLPAHMTPPAPPGAPASAGESNQPLPASPMGRQILYSERGGGHGDADPQPSLPPPLCTKVCPCKPAADSSGRGDWLCYWWVLVCLGFLKLRTAINSILICFGWALSACGPRPPGMEGAAGLGGFPCGGTPLRSSIGEAVDPGLCHPESLGCVWQLLLCPQERCPLARSHAL